ncbi:MAG TPA: glycosyltransferase family 4 protein [Solirubrobacterales bacterium]
MRAAVYLDQAFWREGEEIYAARSFVLFLGKLAEHFDELTVTARLSPEPSSSHYRLPPPARFAPLPHYGSAARPTSVVRAARESAARFAELLERVDVVWLLGPHPFALLFARMAARRGKRVVLGVRQDLPRYVGNRHPRRPDLKLVAESLDLAYRRLARRHPVVVVGPDLARNYRGARELLQIYVSLISTADIDPVESRATRDYDGPVRMLSVGRIDAEKNPLMLADVLERLEHRFELTVCGDGPLEAELASRVADRGLQARARLHGHVPMGEELMRLYRESDLFLHVSWTEGVPQVLLESFAAALPVVATAVGGVSEAAGEGALLIPPGDPDAAAEAVRQVATSRELRARLLSAGHAIAENHTIEAEAKRVACFLRRS